MTAGVDAARAAASAALNRRLDRGSPRPLAVAVSGGGDSVALLHLAADWAREAARSVCVLTVDHGLHRDSDAWSEAVRAAAGRHDLPCTVHRWEGDKPTAGQAAAARAARHALLAEAARTAGVRVLLMGHTADDLAEAEIMRAGGSSVPDPREWAPSPAWPEGRGLFVLRPLLGAGRDDLRALLRDRDETWIEDPANADLRFARARARRLIPSPLAGEEPAPDLIRGGARAPDEGSGAGAPREGSVARCGGERVPRDRTSPSALPRATPHPSAPRPPSPTRGEGTHWGGLKFSFGEGLSRRLLSAAVLCASGRTVPPRGEKVGRLAERVAGPEPFNATLSGARVVSDGERLTFGRDPGRAGLPSTAADSGEALIWDGRFEVAVEEAGTVAPLAGRAARLSRAERAALAAVPAWARPTLPVLETPAGSVRLLAEARPLALERLRAACGVYAVEADLPPF